MVSVLCGSSGLPIARIAFEPILFDILMNLKFPSDRFNAASTGSRSGQME
jgi:hypothetical protein